MVECKLACTLLILHFCLVENFVPQLWARRFRYGGLDSPQLATRQPAIEGRSFQLGKRTFCPVQKSKIIRLNMHLSTLLLFLNPWKGLCYPSFSGVFGAVLLHYLQELW